MPLAIKIGMRQCSAWISSSSSSTTMKFTFSASVCALGVTSEDALAVAAALEHPSGGGYKVPVATVKAVCGSDADVGSDGDGDGDCCWASVERVRGVMLAAIKLGDVTHVVPLAELVGEAEAREMHAEMDRYKVAEAETRAFLAGYGLEMLCT